MSNSESGEFLPNLVNKGKKMISVDEINEKLKELEEFGTTNILKNMKQADFDEYKNDLYDLSKKFKILQDRTSKSKDQNLLITDISDRLGLLNGFVIDAAVKRKIWDESFKGRLGVKKPLSSKEKEAAKQKALKTQEKELQDIKDRLAKVKIEKDTIMQEIKKTREEKADKRYGSDIEAPKSKGILTAAVNEFNSALVPPLLDEDFILLQRKRDALDELEAVSILYEKNSEDFKSIREKVKRVIIGTASVAGEFTEETTGGVLKAGILFLAWPIVLPIKLLNTGFSATKYAFCFADGAVGFLDKGLDGFLDALIGKLDRNEKGDIIKSSPLNILKGIPHVVVRGPLMVVRGVCKIGAIGFRWLEKNVDSDRWLKQAPVTSGFVLGGVGTVVIIGVALASVFTFGIPIAALAVGLGGACIGAAVYGYFKGKAKKDELTELRLSDSDTSRLEKWEYDRRYRQQKTPEPEVKNKKDEITIDTSVLEKHQELDKERRSKIDENVTTLTSASAITHDFDQKSKTTPTLLIPENDSTKKLTPPQKNQ